MTSRHLRQRRRELFINMAMAVFFLIVFAMALYAYELQLAATVPQ